MKKNIKFGEICNLSGYDLVIAGRTIPSESLVDNLKVDKVEEIFIANDNRDNRDIMPCVYQVQVLVGRYDVFTEYERLFTSIDMALKAFSRKVCKYNTWDEARISIHAVNIY